MSGPTGSGVRDVRQYHTADYLLGTPLLADSLEKASRSLLACE
jgi:hypothetical protein